MPKINPGDTAWVLAASALVLFMTPGLAFFYGGMVRVKSVLNMLMMSFLCIGLVSVLWVLYGYSLSFAPDAAGGLIGNLDNIGLKTTIGQVSGTIPVLVFSAFQLMFAIITPALISGAIADRARFGAWTLFAGLWVTIVYFPVAHWVFAFGGTGHNDGGGWIADRLNAFDFAGGTAVHINAGAAALALALVLGKRRGWPRESMKPHNVPFVVLGAGMLWFGWFGFNAGSALAANDTAALAFVNTQVATAAAALAWIAVEKFRDGHATTLGFASGAVAGLVGITPACAFISPLGSILLGIICGAGCAYAVGLKFKLGFDDSLDVVGVHLVGGILGSLLVGLLATHTAAATGGVDGLLYGGGLTQLLKQFVAVVAVGGYSFVLSYILGKAVDKTIGFRVTEDVEVDGIDAGEHAETAYDLTPLSGRSGAPSPRTVSVPSEVNA